ncbi:MAG: bifunctional hydroxymethylpyrimidine kinase/phosphomethylpyrimidine kinase [Gemmatimonadota bacterium]
MRPGDPDGADAPLGAAPPTQRVRRRPVRVALTIAGSDSGGGAGIQADLKTFHAFGVFGTSALTAITAQNTTGVFGIQKVDPDLVAAQIRVVAEDLHPAACKTGMLADAPIIGAVTSALRECEIPHLVVDPVMVAASGDPLLEEPAVEALRSELLPLATLVTPNLYETEMLSGMEVGDETAMRSAAEKLVACGCRAVLVKGGHLSGSEVVDVLFDGARWREWRAPRLERGNAHGTGCTLSAAIAAGLAHGADLLEAVEAGLSFTRRAIAGAPGLGAGGTPLDHWAAVEPRPARTRC